MAEQGHVYGLGVDYGMEIRANGSYPVVMDGKMGVEFVGHALEPALPRRIQATGLATSVDSDTGNIGSRVILDLAQALPGTADQESGSSQLGDRLGKLNITCLWEKITWLDRPT
jgi:hypothetical protein